MGLGKPKIISLFSGAGGLDIGFEKAGFRTIYATDVWKTACDTLKKNHLANEVYCGDIRDIDFKALKERYKDIDCLIGGPPCPPYSQTRHYLIGKADGFQDEHAGFAVPEYFRALKELQPKVFFFENVDGFDRLQPRKKIAKDNTIYAEALLHKSKIHLRVHYCKMYFIFYSRK